MVLCHMLHVYIINIFNYNNNKIQELHGHLVFFAEVAAVVCDVVVDVCLQPGLVLTSSRAGLGQLSGQLTLFP